MTSSSGAVLTFTPQPHEYRVDGRRVPGVTSILGALGISEDWDALAGISPRVGRSIEDKCDIGSAAHADCHSFDDSDIAWETVDPRVLPYVKAWQAFRDNSRMVPTTRERRIFSRVHHFAGTLDGIFLTPTGERVLIDIKTSATLDPASSLQVAAYEIAWTEEHPDAPIAERWIVQLTPKLKVPYRIWNCSAEPDAWMDRAKFLACVTVYWLQAARRKESR